jgi:hypothetical protein
VISPLLANVYLHYVFDLWVERWRHREAVGNVIIVRYADDLIIGFELDDTARLDQRAKHGLQIERRAKRVCGAGDVVVIPGGTEHEGWFPEDTEVIDFFAPPREDFYSAANLPT